MVIKKIKIYLLAATTIVTTFAEAVIVPAEAIANKLGAATVSEVKFEEGQATLKSQEIEEMKKAVNSAKGNGKITEVKVISWADMEYSPRGEKATPTEVRLAARRADKIKQYMTKDLGLKDVKIYNMAERPAILQDLIKSNSSNSDREVDADLFGTKGRSSKAIVMVFTK